MVAVPLNAGAAGSVTAGSVASGAEMSGGSVAGAVPPQADRIMLASMTSDNKRYRLRFTVLLLRELGGISTLRAIGKIYAAKPPSETFGRMLLCSLHNYRCDLDCHKAAALIGSCSSNSIVIHNPVFSSYR